jgi:stress response protein SCP2
MSDPHIDQKVGHRIESETSCSAQGKIDYAVSTDNDQGFIFYQNGNLIIRNKATSMELCGENLTDDKSPAKTIDAANGDIHIRAKNGTIILEAANIRLVGVDGKGGEITLQASKQVHMDAPTVGAQGTNITLAASQSSSIAGGGSVEVTASGQVTTSSGTDTDSSSFLGQILQAIKKFKEFFNSICA